MSFKIHNGISNYSWHFLNISPQTRNLLSRQFSKTKSINQFDYFADWVKYFGTNCLSQSKTEIVRKISRLNGMISEKNGQKKNLKGYFQEILDDLLNRIWFEYRSCINSIYVMFIDSFFF